MKDSANKSGWLTRLRAGLTRSSARLGDGIARIFTHRRLDDDTLEQLEDLLIEADLGIATATKLTENIARDRFGREVTPDEIRAALAAAIAEILAPAAVPLKIEPGHAPHVVLIAGVNGSGKTTTIGKLAHTWRAEGHRVLLAAGDTFRAAAIEQLKIWGTRADCPVVTGAPGADAAGLAYEAMDRARRENFDVLLIDTAGRLHNRAELMAELEKIARVLKKLDPEAPHSALLVLDATTGQNAQAQVETFRDAIGITGLVMTKLDGTARGGVVVGLADRFGLPVHAVGVGEGIDDLRPFEADGFARGLLGLDG